MANHCYDLICMDCGALWCALGCNTDWPPSKERVERYEKKFTERGWRQKASERCSSCQGRNVYAA